MANVSPSELNRDLTKADRRGFRRIVKRHADLYNQDLAELRGQKKESSALVHEAEIKLQRKHTKQVMSAQGRQAFAERTRLHQELRENLVQDREEWAKQQAKRRICGHDFPNAHPQVANRPPNSARAARHTLGSVPLPQGWSGPSPATDAAGSIYPTRRNPTPQELRQQKQDYRGMLEAHDANSALLPARPHSAYAVVGRHNLTRSGGQSTNQEATSLNYPSHAWNNIETKVVGRFCRWVANG